MARKRDITAIVNKGVPAGQDAAPPDGGRQVDHRSLLRKARIVASVGLAGAAVGGTVITILPILGFASMAAEVVGLLVGLAAGAVLVFRHAI